MLLACISWCSGNVGNNRIDIPAKGTLSGGTTSAPPFKAALESSPFTPVPATPSTVNSPLVYEHRTLSDFATRGSRMGFIRKVFSIFSAQMMTTILITYTIMNNPVLATFLQENYKAISLLSFLFSTGIVFLLGSHPSLRFKAPQNLVLLGIYTVLQSVVVGTLSSLFEPRLVCLGTMHTFMVFISIVLYSFQPNPSIDVTVFGSGLLSILVSLLTGSILGSYFQLPLMDNIISGLLAVLFAVYIFYDTQKIIGGKHHKHQFGQNEYILAALSLYQDVINFFVEILTLLAKNDKKTKKNV